MNSYSWAEVKRSAIKAFGDELPNAQTEQDVLDAFGDQPAAVVAAIESVAQAKRNGQVRSGWAVLRKRVVSVGSVIDVVVNDRTERDAVVRRVAHWMNHAGLLFDRESEVEDEACRMLRTFAREDDLLDQCMGLWRKLRPHGEELERASAEYQLGLRRKAEELRAARLEKEKALITAQTGAAA